MEEKEVVRKKFNVAKFLVILLVLYIICFNIYKLVISPINNIYIIGNKTVTDQEVIDLAGIRNYPSFILTSKSKIKKKLLKNELIKKVQVKKQIGKIVTITIEENIPLFIYNNKVILSNSKQLDNDSFKLPTLYGDLENDILEKLIEKYQEVNDEIKVMISEIKYDPNNIDKERFLLTMNDGNYVYITLYKMSSINEYIKILSKLDEKGILYLDSGNYFKAIK